MRIVFYATRARHPPALDRLTQLQDRDRYRLLHTLAAMFELELRGRELGPPVLLHVADGIYELRPLCERPVRLLFFFHEEVAVVLGTLERTCGPLPIESLVRACRVRRDYERDPQGRSHDGFAELERLGRFDAELCERIHEERLVLQVAQAAHLFRQRARGRLPEVDSGDGLDLRTLKELERGGVRTQAVRRLQRIAWRLELDVRLVLVPRPRNGRRHPNR